MSEDGRALYVVAKDKPGFWDCAYYSCDDAAEELTDSDPDEAIECYLDGIMCGRCDFKPCHCATLDVLQRALGETVTVYGYTRRKVELRRSLPGNILGDVLEELDEEYGNPHEATEPTPAMVDAAKAFAEVVESEYRVWICECTHSATVNIEAWVRENAPEWLEP